MAIQFELSASTLEQYRRLQFEPDSPFKCIWLPFGTIVWRDEHPLDDDSDLMLPRGEDLEVIFRLIVARQHIWHDGHLPKDLNSFWTEARQAIPNWPGFQRLKPTEEQYSTILACEAESRRIQDEWTEALSNEADEIETENIGGGLERYAYTFSVKKKKADNVIPLRGEKGRLPTRRWWQFWR